MSLLHFVTILSLLRHINGDSNNLRSTPVFIIDYDHVHTGSSDLTSNPFLFLSESFFQTIIDQCKERAATVVIFVEERLCTEDLSTKDHLGTPYYHLQRSMAENQTFYFPAVINPFNIISETLPKQEFNVYYLRSANTKLKISPNAKYFYVYFEDGKNETRCNALRRHDLIMQEVYFVTRQLASGPVVAIYTGMINPVTKHALSYSSSLSDATPKPSVLHFNTDTAQYKFAG